MTRRTRTGAAGVLLALALLFGVLFPASPAGAGTACATLESGYLVNARMKTLASGTEQGAISQTEDIKAIRMAESLPEGFVPSAANTVSTADSPYPVYIFFDNGDEAGVMYFYTEADTVVMNPQSHFMFAGNTALADISGVAGWDASRVETMYAMFDSARSLPDALALKDWDTSCVKDMSFMFSGDLSLRVVDVSNWDTSKVTTMANMFQVGDNWMGNAALQDIRGLGNLDVSNVTDMTCMFYGAGLMTEYDIGGWDVSKVESMNHMFCDNRVLQSLDLSAWDVSSVKTMHCMFDDNHRLRTIGDVSRWNTSSLIDAGGWLNGANFFWGENGMLDLSGWDTRNLQCAGEMFFMTGVRAVDLSGWTFDAVTNDLWEGAGSGIYYETGNSSEALRGMGQMFRSMPNLVVVYVSQAGMDSFSAAVEKGVNVTDMWLDTHIDHFTVN